MTSKSQISEAFRHNIERSLRLLVSFEKISALLAILSLNVYQIPPNLFCYFGTKRALSTMKAVSYSSSTNCFLIILYQYFTQYQIPYSDLVSLQELLLGSCSIAGAFKITDSKESSLLWSYDWFPFTYCIHKLNLVISRKLSIFGKSSALKLSFHSQGKNFRSFYVL